MYTDKGLILASEEAPPNGGALPGGLGAASVTLAYDLATAHDVAGTIISDPSVSDLELEITVDTSFVGAEPTTDADVTVTFELVSMPIALSLLTNATTSGKDTSIAGVVATDSGNTFTIAGHGLQVGTPFYLNALGTTSTPAIDTILYVSSAGLATNTFVCALTRANAIAGASTQAIDANGTCEVQFLPFIHATTGQIPFSALQAGARYVAKVQPYSIEASSKVTHGSAPGRATSNLGWLPTANRYLALRVLTTEGGAGTAGRYTANLGVNMQSGQRHYATASTIA